MGKIVAIRIVFVDTACGEWLHVPPHVVTLLCRNGEEIAGKVSFSSEEEEEECPTNPSFRTQSASLIFEEESGGGLSRREVLEQKSPKYLSIKH